MANMKPVSDLRNFNEVLKEIGIGSPVILTENGRSKYVIVAIEAYEKIQATINLFSKLMEAENRIRVDQDWMTEEQVRGELGV